MVTITSITNEDISLFIQGVTSFCDRFEHRNGLLADVVREKSWDCFTRRLEFGVDSTNLSAYGYAIARTKYLDAKRSSRFVKTVSPASCVDDELSFLDFAEAKVTREYDDEWEATLDDRGREIINWILNDMPEVKIGKRTKTTVTRLVASHFSLSKKQVNSVMDYLRKQFECEYGFFE